MTKLFDLTFKVYEEGGIRAGVSILLVQSSLTVRPDWGAKGNLFQWHRDKSFEKTELFHDEVELWPHSIFFKIASLRFCELFFVFVLGYGMRGGGV